MNKERSEEILHLLVEQKVQEEEEDLSSCLIIIWYFMLRQNSVLSPQKSSLISFKTHSCL